MHIFHRYGPWSEERMAIFTGFFTGVQRLAHQERSCLTCNKKKIRTIGTA